jgi:hypothetical protein
MRANRIEEANALAKKIGVLIIKRDSSYLKHNGGRYDVKDMWAKVSQLSNRVKPQLKIPSPRLNSTIIFVPYHKTTNRHHQTEGAL